MKKKVNLLGTCGASGWRKELMNRIDLNKIDVFNPVVSDWTPKRENIEDKRKADPGRINLFVITPETPSLYSASEVTAASILEPRRTIICVLAEAGGKKFEKHEAEEWEKIKQDCKKSGAKICLDLDEVADILMGDDYGKI